MTNTLGSVLKKYNSRIGRLSGQYAIEIEAEFSRSLGEHYVDGFLTTTDNSLRGYGYEFISRKPESKQVLMEQVDTLLKEPFFERYIDSTRTSTHVHVNVCNWTHEQLLQVLLTYYIVEPYISEFAGQSRQSNLFCLRMYDAEDVMNILKKVVDQDWSYVASERAFNTYKYSALNVASIGRLGSIEFRQMRGTKDVTEINRWLNLIDSVINYALSFRSIDDVWAAFSRSSSDFFTRATGHNVVDTYRYDNNYSNVFCLYNYYKDAPKRISTGKYVCPYDFGKSPFVLEFGERVVV